ncbi:MAG: polysaccharide deacetylase family protein [Magnetococcales bacterium]|nr:polysaccharide deacetylase family protein [Magnetococcales bacterium]
MRQMLYRRFPGLARRRYARLCRELLANGKTRHIYLLSFDCDNPEDLPALRSLLPLLDELAIRVAIAAPGEILQRDPAFFRQLHQDGHELMGHGWRQHSAIRDGQYLSTLYYHNLTDAQLDEEITRSRDAVASLTGAPPAGFRIPHFGHSNTPEELHRVHSRLPPLGIAYSSSTLPRMAIRHGPLYPAQEGLLELPISPSFCKPTAILDTFSHGFDHRAKPAKSFQEYHAEFMRMLEYAVRKPAWVCNLYCDPSQAVGMQGWWEKTVRAAHAHGFSFQTLDQFRKPYAIPPATPAILRP